jgi:lysophospholipid acyltransferase (LPLAT)-like uncharacterized protein
MGAYGRAMTNELRQWPESHAFWEAIGIPFTFGFKFWADAVLLTARIEVNGPGLAHTGPALYVNWHRYLPFLGVHHGQHRRAFMISPAPRLAPIGRWCELVGLQLVKGTSGNQGRQAIDEMVKLLGSGQSAFMAVDGPAGPLFKVKRGCVEIARAAQVPIIPVGYTSKRGFHQPGRWDQWLMMVPFDELVVTYGATIEIGPDEPLESATERVAAGLRAICDSSDDPVPNG